MMMMPVQLHVLLLLPSVYEQINDGILLKRVTEPCGRHEICSICLETTMDLKLDRDVIVPFCSVT